ncbi:tRNA pseudouridine(38-40) synthase TruA [Paludibacter sp. 221]|uniref:tRNA pseudouridine(38-40) synthase TruA n=1 Tax=Paludibacter sp. 221 TaxID=2302939 RepID=UPI0013D4BBA6|nr:tRNA pseudouridine(38-40) synthase TruA [Paludibacter sp. 221]
MKKRYFLYCSYKGTAYHGWQVQPNGVSVQEVLTDALRTILRAPHLDIVGAGRTDTGVHAKMMVAHFDAKIVDFTLNDLCGKLNSFLPADIAVEKIAEVKPDAHARFDAVSRRYEYHVVLQKKVFTTDFAARIHHPLDFEKMNEAAAVLYEYRDFTSFSKLHTDVKTNNCTITHARWAKEGDEWVFTIEADRFLRNMVRAIVGTLFEVGRGKLSVEGFRAVIEEKDRCKAGTSAPAQGLFLVDVKYPEEIFKT